MSIDRHRARDLAADLAWIEQEWGSHTAEMVRAWIFAPAKKRPVPPRPRPGVGYTDGSIPEHLRLMSRRGVTQL